MSNGASNFFACGPSRRGSSRESQVVYGKYLNNCDDVRKNLTDWLKERNIVLVSIFPLLSIMYLDNVEEYCRKEDSIEKEIQDLGFRGLLILIYEGTKPRRQVEENVIQLRSEKTVICQTPQNENEIVRMKRFIQEKAFSESQTAYGKYLNKCDDVIPSLIDCLRKKEIDLKPMGKIGMFPLLSIMYIDDIEEYSRKEDSIEKDIQDLGFRGLLILIYEGTKPRRHVEENVIQLWSENTIISQTRQNEDEIVRMKRFIQEKERMFAFSHDRKKGDQVLDDAVKFIEKKCNIRLVDVNDPKDVKNVKGKDESPLVVFCKNDSQLQEDIENAKTNVRCGSDVMLLVLTNRKDMHLVDTKATKNFYMKSPLIFSSVRKRFRKKNNLACILWLHKFIELSGCNVSRKLSRYESLQRSFRQLRKREEKGVYKKLHNVSEEMEKRAVIYFQEKQNLSLQRMADDYQESRPFILFCRDGESAEDDINQFIKERQATSDLSMTVVVLLRCERQKPVDIHNVPNIQRLLIRSSQEPTILPTPANGRVANKVRECLLAKRFDEESIIKKEEEDTYKAQRCTEKENKVSVATNSMKQQPKSTNKYVTQHDTRESTSIFALSVNEREPAILPTPANVRVSEQVTEILLAKRSDEEPIEKKEEEVTHKAKRSTEEEKNMSGAMNSVKRQPVTSSKHLTQCYTRGFYKKLHNVSEEMEKSAVTFLKGKQNMSLKRMGDDCQESRSFILFCRDCESAEDDINQFIEKRQTKCGGDLHTIVLLLSCEGQKSVDITCLPNIQRLFIRSSQEPTILPTPENVGVSDKVKEFLLAKRSDKGSNEFKKEEEVTCKSKRSTEEENKKNSATNSKKQPETSLEHLAQPDTRDMKSKLNKLAVSAGLHSVEGIIISKEATV